MWKCGIVICIMLMDGKTLALEISVLLQATLLKTDSLPSLGILLVGDDAASAQYVRTKQKFGERIGVPVELVLLPRDASEATVLESLRALDAKHSGLIVQLPLPFGFDTKTILATIPPEKDVDVLSPSARDAFVKQLSGALTPPVPLAILALLTAYDVAVKEKRVVLVGRGKLVGEPTGIVLGRLGAELAYAEKGTKNMHELTSIADVVVAGTGVPGLITSDMVSEGAVVIDAGTSEAGGKLVGDVDPAVGEKCRLLAPVPGGVGPLTVAMLFVNLFALRGLVAPQSLLQSLKKSV